jgi:hypothetical protein
MKKIWIMLVLLVSACTPRNEDRRQKNHAPRSAGTETAPPPSVSTEVAQPQGAWLATLGSNDECTLIYQFENQQNLTTSLNCLNSIDRTIQRETRRYQLAFDGRTSNMRLTLVETSCNPTRAAQLKNEQTLFFRSAQAEKLELSISQIFDKALTLHNAQAWLDSAFDLRGTSYRGLPVKLGCFSDDRMTQFEQQQP